MTVFLDSLKQAIPDSVFNSGGGEYRDYMKFMNFWKPRLYPHGDFKKYFNAIDAFYGKMKSTPYIKEWIELGPNKSTDNSGLGIGPIEFITFYDNGTAISTDTMLAGSTLGGLFFSTDYGSHWNKTGTDTYLEQSGCSWAVFDPTTASTWYASTSSNCDGNTSLWIGYTGGVYRTEDYGVTFNKIGDRFDFGGYWTIIYKLLIDPNDRNVLFAATSNGIYKTTNCRDISPVWIKVENGYIYDIEFKPNDNKILYATLMDVNNQYNSTEKKWYVVQSVDYGNTWNPISTQPASIVQTDPNPRYYGFTIEVSKAKPEHLFCCFNNNNNGWIYEYDFQSPGWNQLTTGFSTSFGFGHGFGVEQTTSGDDIFCTKALYLAKFNCIDLTLNTTYNIGHVDVEDIICHPYYPDHVWIGNHGGVALSKDNGVHFELKVEGLGVSQVSRMATSYSDPNSIIVGAYHDGSCLTETPYITYPNWDPSWRNLIWGDGWRPLIDNKQSNNMWASSQNGGWVMSNDYFQHATYINCVSLHETEGVLNKINPNWTYFIGTKPTVPFTYNSRAIIRSFSQGIPSSRETIHPTNLNNSYWRVWQLFTHISNKDRLFATIIEDDGINPLVFRLINTHNANEIPASNVKWQELAVPRDDYWITNINFDPDNPNIVYIAYGSPIGNTYPISDGLIYKVDYSNGSNNPIFTDLSENLPYTFTGSDCIAIEQGTSGGIYLATDFGVFYTNNAFMQNGTNWVRYGSKLPHTSSNGLEINYPSNTIRNGTYGRGVWEISMPCNYYTDEYRISTNTTWSINMRMDRDVVVEQGATLTITNGAIASFPDDARLIVEQGGKLILDNCLLTNACDGLWRGIEVWGDNSQSQVTQGAQGILIMKNGAIIENAQEAVAVREGNPDFTPVWGTFGGIVRIKDCIFRNNRRSISFGSYDNFNPNTGAIINNLSYIINNVFTWDDALLNNAVPFSHISMWDVKGVKIQGNEFRNDDLATYSNPFDRGMGINSIDAEYQVQPRCVSLSLPCSSYDNNTFINLAYGIKVENGDRNKSVVVNHSDFYNCYRSIYFKNMEFGEITNCNFDVAQEIVSGGMTNYPTYGIYLDNCNAYEVEENNITSSNHGTYGIYIKASGDLANEIYNNNISGVEVATQAEGENGKPSAATLPSGLVYRCNSFVSSRFVDMAVTKDITTYQDGTIRKDQGDCGTAESPANNMFSTPNYAHIYLENMMLMNYYYSSGNPDLIPTNNVYPPGGVFNGIECLDPFNQNTSCPLRQGINNDPIAIIGTINQLHANLQQINSVIDGGDTDALLNLLNSSAADWQIKNELIAASPHLSEEVLIAMINRSPALPDWVIDQVLSANAPLTDNVFLSMVNRSQRLPDYIIRNLAIASSPLNTAEQLALINQTPVYPTWILRQILIENSPLFDEVLLALLSQDPSMENWAIRDVFMQNTPLSYDVEQALNNHFPAYPNWVINGIYNSPYIAGEPIEQAQPLSPLLETYVEISNIEHYIALNTNELFRVYLHDTTGSYGIKDVVTYMEQNNLGKKANEISLACAYITSEENMKAQHKLDSLIQDSSLTDFCNYHSALITLNQSTPAILDTTTNSIITQAVETVAYSTSAKREKAGAESLLEFADLVSFDESFAPIIMMQKSSQQQNNTPKVADGTVKLMDINFEEDYVKIYPNPNAGKFYVEYHIKDIEHGVFILQDISGKEILRIDLTKEEEKLSVNKNLSAGVYIYQILLGDCIYTKDKIVVSEQ